MVVVVVVAGMAMQMVALVMVVMAVVAVVVVPLLPDAYTIACTRGERDVSEIQFPYTINHTQHLAFIVSPSLTYMLRLAMVAVAVSWCLVRLLTVRVSTQLS